MADLSALSGLWDDFQPETRSKLRALGDTATKFIAGVPRAASGLVGLGSFVPGVNELADPVSQGLNRGADWFEEQLLSDYQRKKDAELSRVLAVEDGFVDSAVAAGKYLYDNPSQAVINAIGSVPSMVAGGYLGKGARTAAAGLGLKPLSAASAAAIGEGGVIAGSVASEIAERNPDDFAARYYGIPAGIAGAAIGRLGGRIAGDSDIDTLITKGIAREALDAGAPLNLLKSTPKRIGMGAVSEGLIEEAPQSMVERAMTNLGTNRPWHEGLGAEGVIGGASGSLMGGAAGVRRPGNTYTMPERDQALSILSDPSAPIESRMEAAQFLQRLDSNGKPVDLLQLREEALRQNNDFVLNEAIQAAAAAREQEAYATIDESGVINPYDTAGYVRGVGLGQQTTVDGFSPQDDLFGGTNISPSEGLPTGPIPSSYQTDMFGSQPVDTKAAPAPKGKKGLSASSATAGVPRVAPATGVSSTQSQPSRYDVVAKEFANAGGPKATFGRFMSKLAESYGVKAEGKVRAIDRLTDDQIAEGILSAAREGRLKSHLDAYGKIYERITGENFDEAAARKDAEESAKTKVETKAEEDTAEDNPLSNFIQSQLNTLGKRDRTIVEAMMYNTGESAESVGKANNLSGQAVANVVKKFMTNVVKRAKDAGFTQEDLQKAIATRSVQAAAEADAPVSQLDERDVYGTEDTEATMVTVDTANSDATMEGSGKGTGYKGKDIKAMSDDQLQQYAADLAEKGDMETLQPVMDEVRARTTKQKAKKEKPNAKNGRQSKNVDAQAEETGDAPASETRVADEGGVAASEENEDAVIAEAVNNRTADGLVAKAAKLPVGGKRVVRRNADLSAGVTNNDELAPEIKRSVGASQGTTVEAINKALSEWFFSPKQMADKLVVVQKWDQLPADVKARAEEGVGSDKNATTQGFIDPVTLKAYLIADNIDKGEERSVFMHEVGSHLGLTEEEELQASKRVRAWRTAPEGSVERSVYDKTMKRMADAGEVSDAELVAYATEEAVNAGIAPKAVRLSNRAPKGSVQEFINYVARLFMEKAKRALGIHTRMFTAQDLIDLTYGAARITEDANIGQISYSSNIRPLWYSRAAAYIEQKAPKASLTAQKWMDNLNAWVKAGNIKKDELEWSGVENWLNAQQGVVSRDELVNFFNNGGVQVEEKVLGGVQDVEAMALQMFGKPYSDLSMEETSKVVAAVKNAEDKTHYASYTEPGAKEGSYREILLKLPKGDGTRLRKGLEYRQMDDGTWNLWDRDEWVFRKGFPSKTILEMRAAEDPMLTIHGEPAKHKAPHYGDENENILATARINERTDAEGNRVLYVEEIQSDWAQDLRKDMLSPSELAEYKKLQAMQDDFLAGRIGTDQYTSEVSARRDALEEKANYRTPDEVPRTNNAPFIGKTEQWAGLILKRLMRYAADNGFDKVAWSTGEQQFNRWGSERVSWKQQGPGFVVSAQEQVGGRAGGMDIEEMARSRGELLESSGEYITTRGGLYDTLKSIMSRENNDQQINAMTDKLWNRMQAEPEGDFLPRRDGMRGFYGDEQGRAPDGKPSWLANALKALPAEIRPKLESVAIPGGNPRLAHITGTKENTNPGFTVDKSLANRPMPLFSKKDEDAISKLSDAAFAHYLANVTGNPETVKEVLRHGSIPASLRRSMMLEAMRQRNLPENRAKQRDLFPTFKAVDTNSDEFKEWFGDSKVVDADGKPLRVYHGTGADILEFDTAASEMRGTDTELDLISPLGSHFAQDSAVGSNFGKRGSVYPVYLSIKNPRRFDSELDLRDEMLSLDWRIPEVEDVLSFPAERSGFFSPSGRRVLNDETYDGDLFSRYDEDVEFRRAVNEAAMNLSSAESEPETHHSNLKALAEAWKSANPGIDGVIYENGSDKEVRGAKSRTAYITFSPTQIKSAISNTGEFSKTNSGIRYSKRANVTEALAKALPAPAQESVRFAADTAKDAARRGLYFSIFTDDLIDAVDKHLPSARRWYDAFTAKMVEMTKREKRVADIAEGLNNLSYSNNDAFRDAMTLGRDMRIEQKWAYQPTWRSEVKVDEDMARRYNELKRKSPEAAKLLDQALQYGYETLNDIRRISTELANEAYPEDTEEAARQRRMMESKLPPTDMPYLPLRRVGTHLFYGKSQAFLDAEKEGDTKAIEEMQQDENHYVFKMFDSYAEAAAYQRAYGAKYAKHAAKAKEKFFNDTDALPFRYFEKIKMMTEGMDSAAAQKVNNLVTELYLTSLADTSARKSELRAKGVAGMSADDMFRAFVSKGVADAHYIASLKNGKVVSKAFNDMRQEARKSDDPAAADAMNELAARYANSFEHDPAPIINKLMRANSLWMLLTKPAYYLFNATQPALMAHPFMAHKFGYTRTANEMQRAYKDYLSLKNVLKPGEIDLSQLPADVRQAVADLVEKGKIDITLSQELGDFLQSSKTTPGRVMDWAGQKLRGAVQKGEMMNRVVTGVTAYRMEKARTGSHEKALEYAAKVIDKTQGNYAGFNAPRLMNQNAAMRLITQFRKFQLIQATYLVNAVREISKGATLQEKWALSAMLRYTLMHHALLAGAMGLPLMNVIALVFAATGGDDEPRDLELSLREWIGDDVTANLLLKGVFANPLTNVDISKNVGMSGAFQLTGGELDLTSRDGLARTVLGLLGPTTGLAAQGVDAMAAFGRGDYYKGLEALMPSVVKSTMKSIREATEGQTNTRGDMLVDPEEINLLQSTLKALGFRSADDSVRQLIRGKKYEFEQFFNKRTSELKNQYAQAYRSGDAEKMKELRESWTAMQQSKRDLGFTTQPLSTLLKAPSERAKRERNTADGVQYNKASQKFVERFTGT